MVSGISSARDSGTMPYFRQFSLFTGMTIFRAQMKSTFRREVSSTFIFGSLNTSITSWIIIGEPSS